MAIKIMDEDDFRELLRVLLDNDHNICWELVSQAISMVGDFEEYDFFDTDEFFTIFCQGRNQADQVRAIVNGFFDGYDLDEGTSPADPNADYLRWDGDDIDSTDHPADYIYEEAIEEIIDYIVENPDYDWYPKEVKDAIEEYRGYGGDI